MAARELLNIYTYQMFHNKDLVQAALPRTVVNRVFYLSLGRTKESYNRNLGRHHCTSNTNILHIVILRLL